MACRCHRRTQTSALPMYPDPFHESAAQSVAAASPDHQMPAPAQHLCMQQHHRLSQGQHKHWF